MRDAREDAEVELTRPGLPRAVEVALAAAGLLVAAPVLGVAALAVAVTSGTPVLFRHERVGRNGRPFVLLKLRTMTPGDGRGFTPGDDSRVTPVGRLLRLTKLDELPQLWNVLVGDMSFVGPRPEVAAHVDPGASQWREILRVRPGLTDPVTLRLRAEEEILARVEADPEAFYRNVLQPYKLAAYVGYLRVRNWRTDLEVLRDTVLSAVLPGRIPATTLEELLITRGPSPAPDNGRQFP